MPVDKYYGSAPPQEMRSVTDAVRVKKKLLKTVGTVELCTVDPWR